jgi:hypothetical protein
MVGQTPFDELDLGALSLEEALHVDDAIRRLEGPMARGIRAVYQNEANLEPYLEDSLGWYQRGGYQEGGIRVLHWWMEGDERVVGSCRVDGARFPEAELTFVARTALRESSALQGKLIRDRDAWIEQKAAEPGVANIELGPYLSAYAFSSEGLPAGSVNHRLFGEH